MCSSGSFCEFIRHLLLLTAHVCTRRSELFFWLMQQKPQFHRAQEQAPPLLPMSGSPPPPSATASARAWIKRKIENISVLKRSTAGHRSSRLSFHSNSIFIRVNMEQELAPLRAAVREQVSSSPGHTHLETCAIAAAVKKKKKILLVL